VESKKNLINKIIRIRFPDYNKLQRLRLPDLTGQRKQHVLNEDDEKLLSNVERYRSNLDKKSIEQCNAILKREKKRIEKEKRKKEEEQAEAKLFFETRMLKAQAGEKQAVFEYWSKAATWTLEEGILLINKTDPRVPSFISEQTWANTKKLLHQDDYLLAERALEAGKLNATNTPPEFIAWAKQIGLSVPKKLNDLVSKMQVKPDGGGNIQKQPTHKQDSTDDQTEPTINVRKPTAVSMKDEMQCDKEALAEKWRKGEKTFIQMDLSKELVKDKKYKHISPATIEKLTRKA